MHPNLTFFADAEKSQPGTTTEVIDLVVRGPLDHRLLAQAFDGLLGRHDALRDPIVQVHAHSPEDPDSWWTAYRLSEARVTQVVIEEHENPEAFQKNLRLELSRPPLLQVELAPLNGEMHRLRLTTSHAVVDALSNVVLCNDLTVLYAGGPLKPIQQPYTTHLERQFAMWRAGNWESTREHWRQRLSRLEFFTLPRPRRKLTIWPLKKGLRLDLASNEVAALHELANSSQVTPFAAAIALFGMATNEVFGWNEALFVTAVANRSRATRSMIGLFANLVVLRFPINLGPAPALEGARDALARAFVHGHYPLFLLGAEIPPISTVLRAYPRVAVRRTPRLQSPSALGPLRPTTFELMSDGRERVAAHDFGLGSDLLADFSSDLVSLRLTYRGDKIDTEAIQELLIAYQTQIESLVLR